MRLQSEMSRRRLLWSFELNAEACGSEVTQEEVRAVTSDFISLLSSAVKQGVESSGRSLLTWNMHQTKKIFRLGQKMKSNS